MKQLTIGICDNHELTATDLENLVSLIMLELEISCKIRTYHTEEALLQNFLESDIIFLSIEASEVDGIQAGRQIMRANPDSILIVVSEQEKKYKDAFRMGALRFITRPLQKEEVAEALQAAIKPFLGCETIEVSYNRCSCTIMQREISLASAYNGYTEFVAGSKKLRRDMSLSAVEQLLNRELFCRISKQYIVNLSEIEKYDQRNSQVVMLNGQVLNVSRRIRKEFERKHIEYDMKYRKYQ